ncbi:MAG: RraA family protein [Actinomycetota bacterium]
MIVAEFVSHATGTLCNADPGVVPLGAAIRPLIPGRRIAGRARTARIVPGQNAAVHRAVRDAGPGEILVVDGGASDRYGPFGDLLAESCLQRGLAGGVFDCTIRDSADIAALGFQVFARGFHPEPTAKTDPGTTDIPVTVGGALVNPGDVVVGDDDGVVIVPYDIAAHVLEAATRFADREQLIRRRIRGGETTFDIFDIGASP